MEPTPAGVVRALRLFEREAITRAEFVNSLVRALDETEDWTALLSLVPDDIREEVEQKAKDPTYRRFYIGGGSK